jgi:DNA transposition AAA+ family ATPase
MKKNDDKGLFNPEDPNLMTQNFDYTRNMLREYLKSSGKSQSNIAKSIDLSGATLSGFLAGTYKGNMEEVSARVMDFLRLERQRLAAPKEPDFVETLFAKQILQIANYARINKDMAVLHGDAGLGKTFTLEHFVAQHTDVIMITATVDSGSTKAILEKILEKLGRDPRGTISQMAKTIIDLLRGTGWLIIIDESTHLTTQAKEMLRQLHDQAKVGILYCGTHELYSQMYGSHGVVFAQLLSRVGIRCGLHRKNISIDDIKKIFEQSMKLVEECLSFLHTKSLGHGGLRYAKKLYMLACTFAFEVGREITLADLQDAHALLMAQE